MPITRKQSLQLRERDDHCWHCGQVEGLVLHHRRNRGMGGSKMLDRYDNLIRVCLSYNTQMESDPEVAKQAREHGHKLGQWEDFRAPCLDVTENVWYELDQKGFKHEAEQPTTLF